MLTQKSINGMCFLAPELRGSIHMLCRRNGKERDKKKMINHHKENGNQNKQSLFGCYIWKHIKTKKYSGEEI
jgi:hypothetical protein